MKTQWTGRDIAAPADVMWKLLTDVDRWSDWGPSVRGATLSTSRFELGSTGTVRTVVGLDLPFEVTRYSEGRSWSWSVAGCRATDHVVEALGPDASRVAFGVPWVVTPYLAVCRVALQRLSQLGPREVASSPAP